MGYKKTILIIGLLLVILIPNPGVSQVQKEIQAKVPGGKGIPATEPDKDFQKARKSFLKKDLKSSAEAIRKGAAYLKSVGEQAEEGGKQAFLVSMQELEKLADRVEKGTITSVKELDQAFARAHHVMAQHHYLRATESWTKKETLKVGQELKAASRHLERGVKHVGGKVRNDVKPVIKDTRFLARKLIKGTGWVDAEVERGIKALGLEIDKLGEKVKAAKK